MQKKFIISTLLVVVLTSLLFYFKDGNKKENDFPDSKENLGGLVEEKPIHPLQIEQLRLREYPGSEVAIEQQLADGANYRRYLASYKSEGLKIFALLTVPKAEPPPGGWPAIIFNHGYIPPEEYSTTERYVAYVNGFAGNGYVVFKPDYRGHGNSEGNPEGAYYSPAYTVDVLNAVSSVKKLPYVNPSLLGMWGHSMGGQITLRSMVVTKDIKAGVIWAGVVASYQDMAENWHRDRPWRPSERENRAMRPSRQQLIDTYGSFTDNPGFWNSISPINFVAAISGPLQLHHGLADTTVPWEFSRSLKESLEKSGKQVEFYTYENGDHNLSGNNFTSAMQRSIEFFDRFLKKSPTG